MAAVRGVRSWLATGDWGQYRKHPWWAALLFGPAVAAVAALIAGAAWRTLIVPGPDGATVIPVQHASSSLPPPLPPHRAASARPSAPARPAAPAAAAPGRSRSSRHELGTGPDVAGEFEQAVAVEPGPGAVVPAVAAAEFAAAVHRAAEFAAAVHRAAEFAAAVHRAADHGTAQPGESPPPTWPPWFTPPPGTTPGSDRIRRNQDTPPSATTARL